MRRFQRNTETGASTAQVIGIMAFIAIAWSTTVVVSGWIEAEVDSRVERSRKGSAYEAEENVVERDVDGSYTITFHTG